MKRIILSLFVLATVSMNVACKGEKNETGEAGEVATASAESTTYVVNTENSVIESVELIKKSSVVAALSKAI